MPVNCIRHILGALLLCASGLTSSAGIETGLDSIETNPANPTTSSVISLQVTGPSGDCFYVDSYGVTIDSIEFTVDVSLNIVPFGFLGPCPFSTTQSVQVGVLPNAGVYQFSIYDEDSALNPPIFSSQYLLGTFNTQVSLPSPVVFPEVPQEGSIQSGVGLIRGWACDAKSVTVRFDAMPPIDIAYGTSRTDTEAICGDANNGYGMVFAWGTLGQGMHQMQTFIDGHIVSSVEFEVVGLDEPFIHGLSGTYELESFPAPGQSVTVRWSEPDQNFIIIEHNK